MTEALRTTYWVPQTGSKLARFACGTNRSVRAAPPCAIAGAESRPLAASAPAPASPLSKVLRSMVFSQLRLGRLILRQSTSFLGTQPTPGEVHDRRRSY